MKSLDVGQSIPAYTGVILHAENANGNNVDYSAGDTTGYVLETSSPVGTQEMANAILASLSLRGATYQSFQAETVHIDPAFELGDTLAANNTDAIIWASKLNYGRQMAPALGAPLEEEIDHEFPYVSKQEREFTREKEYTRAQLAITATRISAMVSKTGGDPSSFGWELTDHDWTLKSNGSTVFKADSSGVTVTGHITATSGTIGGVTIRNGVLSGITSTNISPGGINGGDGGSLSEHSISDYNVTQGINSGVGYGASYGMALSGVTPATQYFLTSLIYQGRGVQWTTIDGVRVLGQNT